MNTTLIKGFGLMLCGLALNGCQSSGNKNSPSNNVFKNPIANARTSLNGSSKAVTHSNTARNFSFVIPAGWKKQSGDPNSGRVLFTQVPVNKSCSFQFHLTKMQNNFPANTAVIKALKSAKADVKANKLHSAKRRDEFGKANGKKTRFTRGWEVVDVARENKPRRIIYQAYDRESYYINFIASASTPEKFKLCEPKLRQIMKSIKFSAL